MLINGQVAQSGYQGMLNQLSSLKSSFADMISAKEPYFHSLETHKLFNDAFQNLKKKNPIVALKQFESIEKTLPKDKENNSLLSHIYYGMAQSQKSVGDNNAALVSLQRHADAAFQNNEYFPVECAYKELAKLQKEAGNIDKFQQSYKDLLENSLKVKDESEELKARLALGAINRIQENHEEALKHYALAYDLQQGTIDYKAERVEQHEVGFSDRKMGTDNIQQCVAVILHDPLTKKAALAHIDRDTDVSSLSKVINNFSKDSILNAYLVGGRDRTSHGLAISDDNIARTLRELGKYSNIDIKAADIGNKKAPSAIVFDPQTAELKHAVPAKHHETTNARKLLHNLKPELRFAFDLTKSDKIEPVKFTDQDKHKLVLRYLTTPKTSSERVMETWNANLLYDPLAKTVEKIRKENPEIVANAEAQLKSEYIMQGTSQVESTALGRIKKAIVNAFDFISNKISNGFERIKEAASSFIQNIKNSLKTPENKPSNRSISSIEGGQSKHSDRIDEPNNISDKLKSHKEVDQIVTKLRNRSSNDLVNVNSTPPNSFNPKKHQNRGMER